MANDGTLAVGYVAWCSTPDVSHAQAPLAKAALLNLSQLLAAMDSSAWLQAVPAVNQLLVFAMDARPKVRKRAAQSLLEMMAGLQHSPALGAASDLIAKGKAWKMADKSERA